MTYGTVSVTASVLYSRFTYLFAYSLV